jgi:hypothetical protein
MSFVQRRELLTAAVLFASAVSVLPEDARTVTATSLPTAEIVQRMVLHDQASHEELKQYQTLRNYHVEYKGFSVTLEADMKVAVTCDAASGKNLQILSQSGSRFLIENVLKRAVNSEQEVARDRASANLTPANYKFRLVGNDVIDGRPAYILDVDPRVPSKFLYRGKVWVDAADFAVAKIEAQPARNPSIMISRSQFQYTGTKTEGFWVPQQVRGESNVRIGGVAVFTIDYGNYQIASKPSQ